MKLTQFLFLPYSSHFKLYPLIIVNTMLASCDLVILTYYFYYRKKETNDELVKDLLYDVFKDSANS